MLADELRAHDSASRINKEVRRRFADITVKCKLAAEKGQHEYKGIDKNARSLRDWSRGGFNAVDALRGRGGIDDSDWDCYGYSFEYDSNDPEKLNFTREEVKTIASELEKMLKKEGFSTVEVGIEDGWRRFISREERYVFTFLGPKETVTETSLPNYGIWVKVTW